MKLNDGYCVICEEKTVFIETGAWLRDEYICERCKSIPRSRALICALNRFYPSWRDSIIHESSPGTVSSDYIRKYCKNYTCSQYFLDTVPGTYKNNVRCENLEALTFKNESLELLITQDVLEHVLQPEKAFSEIARVLKPGGMHIFTIPWYPNQKTTFRARVKDDSEIEHILEPVYHGNPIDENGALVTVDWGIDFVDFIFRYSGMTTIVYLNKDRYLGLDAEYLEVFISIK